ncbi:hypothetical protein Agub_g5869 [Astrephomene gubernaculifera]|uniref:Ankyrin repeat domain-containing protein n=1 Tax=Astrephomene gubernaculifera TaxID=47775 RepID=A0AAD3DMH6_9CHLO|nr:hypothetical protein Agub_g5869 [Astrephomene gubernaculifera]
MQRQEHVLVDQSVRLATSSSVHPSSSNHDPSPLQPSVVVVLNNDKQPGEVLNAAGGSAQGNASRIWIPDIIQCIARFLPPNEVSCGLRLVDKTAASALRGPEHTGVLVWEPVPHDIFAQRWGAPGAMRSLNLEQRLQLLCLTARTCSVANLEVAVENVGFDTESPVLRSRLEKVMTSAAAAGHLHVCEWLHQRRWPTEDSALDAAAEAGHLHVCKWLEDKHCCVSETTVYAALSEGRTEILDWLGRCFDSLNLAGFLAAAMWGCDLETLKQLHEEVFSDDEQDTGGWRMRRVETEDEDEEDGNEDEEEEKPYFDFKYGEMWAITSNAAGSPTADWQAKLEWIQKVLRIPKDAGAYTGAAGRPDAIARFTWLQQQGYPLYRDDEVAGLAEAVSTGNIAAAEYWLDQGLTAVSWGASLAAERGHLEALQLLHARGCLATDASNKVLRDVMRCAVEGGRVAVVEWLVQVAGLDVLRSPHLLERAAGAGSAVLMRMVHEAGEGEGAALTADVFYQAVISGCEEAVEWLAERGCPVVAPRQVIHCTPYVVAARQGDMAMLRCLRRVGCPWQGSETFTCVRYDSSLPIVRWMVEEGCPVDWAAVLPTYTFGWPGEVEKWLLKRRRQELKRAKEGGLVEGDGK